MLTDELSIRNAMGVACRRPIIPPIVPQGRREGVFMNRVGGNRDLTMIKGGEYRLMRPVLSDFHLIKNSWSI